MKKLISVSIFVLFYCALSAQVSVPDIINIKNFNPDETNEWVPATSLTELYENGAWVNMAYVEYSYNGSGQLENYLSSNWVSDQWQLNTRGSMTYNAQGRISEELTEGWVGSAWVNQFKVIYSYDQNDNTTEMLTKIWQSNDWVNMSRTVYTYTAGFLTEMRMQNWQSSSWVDNIISTYENDSNGNHLVTISQMWLGIQWFNISKSISTYNQDNKVLTELRQSWLGIEWQDQSRSTYTYAADGLIVSVLSESYFGGTWSNEGLQTHQYDANRNQTVILYQTWGSGGWENIFRMTFTYNDITEVGRGEAVISDYKLFNNYPNPFNPSTVIKFQISEYGYVDLRVYDMLGREAAVLVSENKMPGIYELEFNAANLRSGVYFYRLRSGSFEDTKKFLLLK